MKGGGTVMNIVNNTEIWPHYWQYKMNDFSDDELLVQFEVWLIVIM